MLHTLAKRLKTFERGLAERYGTDISTPARKRAAQIHFQVMDHAFLRMLWTNLEEIAPGAWRSNQPDARRLRRYRDMGITTVLSLRGNGITSHYLLERETCADLGLDFVTATLHARKLASRDQILHLLDLFETIGKPFVMHCKSGADRAGLAAALYLLHIEQRPVVEAQRMLSWRYIHFRNAATGVLDHMLDAFAADTAQTPMPIRAWIATRYDPEALTASFAARRPR